MQIASLPIPLRISKMSSGIGPNSTSAGSSLVIVLLCFKMVRPEGIEPPCLVPKTSALSVKPRALGNIKASFMLALTVYI